MDEIKSWVMTLCFAAVAAGMAGIIAPSGNMEKVWKFVVSLFFLACVLVPVFSLKGISISDFTVDTCSAAADSYGVKNLVVSQEVKQMKIEISDLVCNCCKEYGVSPLYVYVTVNIESSSEVSMSGCRIVLSENDMKKKNKLAEAIKTQLGIEATFEKKED